jgi:uncharacterized protein YaaQ
MKLLFIIVDRGYSQNVLELIESLNYSLEIVCYGKGTANSEMLDYFGLGESEKEVIISVVQENQVQNIFEVLSTKSEFSQHGGAVAFTISISSIGKSTLEFIKYLQVNQDKSTEVINGK